MSVHGMIDVVIAAVVVLFAVLGWRRGLFRSLAELAAVVLALVIAAQAANMAAPVVVDRFLRPAAYEAIETQLEEMDMAGGLDGNPYEGARELLEAIPNRFIRESAQELLEGTGIFTAVSYTKAAVLDLGRKAVDAVLDGVVYSLVHSLLCGVLFMVFLFLLRMLVRALELTMKLPVLRQLNEAGGLLLGVVKGLVLVCLGIWVLGRTGILTPEMAEDTLLAGCLAKWTGAFHGGFPT